MRDCLATSMKTAMKNKDTRTLSTIRLIQAAVKDRDIANRGVGKECVGDGEILQILAKMIKQREESAKIYQDAGRDELAKQEREEIIVIEQFMPVQLDQDEVRAICGKIVEEMEASGLRDMGKCINALKERYAGQMDFAFASKLLKELLS